MLVHAAGEKCTPHGCAHHRSHSRLGYAWVPDGAGAVWWPVADNMLAAASATPVRARYTPASM